MRTLPYTIVAPLLAGLAACNGSPVSNAIFAADAEFLAALPSADRQTVSLDDEALAEAEAMAKAARPKAELGEVPELLQLSVDTAVRANVPVYQILGTVDAVREEPPSSRTEDGRSWGPFDIGGGVDVSVEMGRSGAGLYQWTIGAAAGGDEVVVAAGTHYAGDTVAAGDGDFTWHIGDYAALLGDPSTGTLVVDYDNREGVDLVLDLQGWSDGSEDPVDTQYAYRRVDGEGDFQYRTPWDPTDDGVDELATVEVRSRWIAGVGGRSDAKISGGDFGGLTFKWTQCWDASRSTTYQWTYPQAEALPELGDEASCPWSDFADVDRI